MNYTMEKLIPYMDKILYDTIIPIMYISQKEAKTFEHDPIQYIRDQYDF